MRKASAKAIAHAKAKWDKELAEVERLHTYVYELHRVIQLQRLSLHKAYLRYKELSGEHET